MALVIENGSLVPGANSFVSVAEVRAFAEARASILSADDSAIEAACIRSVDYLETLRGEFKGEKVSGTQALQWPRLGVLIDNFEISSEEIPAVLKSAQCQLAIESANGLDLMPSGDGREVIREKVDVLETEYAPGSGANPQPALSKAKALIAPLLRNGSGRIVVIRA